MFQQCTKFRVFNLLLLVSLLVSLLNGLLFRTYFQNSFSRLSLNTVASHFDHLARNFAGNATIFSLSRHTDTGSSTVQKVNGTIFSSRRQTDTGSTVHTVNGTIFSPSRQTDTGSTVHTVNGTIFSPRRPTDSGSTVHTVNGTGRTVNVTSRPRDTGDGERDNVTKQANAGTKQTNNGTNRTNNATGHDASDASGKAKEEVKDVTKNTGKATIIITTTTTNNNNITTPTTAAAVTTKQGVPEAEVRGSSISLVAWGKRVFPKANVTAPWSPPNATATDLCPLVPPNLVGPLKTYPSAPNMTEIARLNRLEAGGHHQPADCLARHRVAVIVPYRDRPDHLRVLLHNLHPMLVRQQLDYFILVVELAQPTTFNRAMLLNVGAVEALGLRDVQCFVLHDVDLVPEHDRNLYTCPDTPRHMSAAVDKFSYRLPYSSLFGGVSALKREHFYKINGYANKYFGWGGEDDDISKRISNAGLKVSRYPMNIARYKMFKHGRDKKNQPNPQRFSMLNQWKKRQPTDGLNSLRYKVAKVEFREGYTWILVNVDMGEVMKS